VRWAILLILALFGWSAPAVAQKRIALSFDDVPRGRGAFLAPDQRTARLITGLKAAGVRQAVFFVTPGNLAEPDGAGGERRIARYAAAGHVLANHSFAHRHLNAIPAADYLADIDRAERWLRGRPGHRPWFRFPFLDEGQGDKAKRDAVRAGLKARGLANGYVTVDGSDWNLETLTVEAATAGRKIDRKALRDLYVETMVEASEFYDRLAVKTTGRSPVHMLLLHETDLAALYIRDLVAGLRKRGWTIVSADEAYADPIAALAMTVDVPSAQGTLTEAIAWAAGEPAPRWYERNNTELQGRLFRERVLHEATK
jgi:peptidoglycan/xylan/chitin deacetylase (PgdA/CDA1 family)